VSHESHLLAIAYNAEAVAPQHPLPWARVVLRAAPGIASSSQYWQQLMTEISGCFADADDS
jgi:hypothetical protein